MFIATFLNYRGFGQASLELGEGVAVLAGPNGAGKTSLCAGIAAVLTESPKPYGVTKERAVTEILSEGSGVDRATISLASSPDAAILAAWPECRIATNGAGPWPKSGGVAAGVVNPCRLDKRAWAKFVAALCRLPAVEPPEVEVALGKLGLSSEVASSATSEFVAQTGDWDALVALWSERATKAKGSWEQITGEHWGDSKSQDWQAPAAAETDPELRRRYDDAQAQLDDLRVQVMDRAKEYGAMPDGKAHDSLNCPSCGVVLALRGGKLVERTGPDEAELKRQRTAKEAAGKTLEEMSKAQQQLQAEAVALQAQISKTGLEKSRAAEATAAARSAAAKVRRCQQLTAFFGEHGFRRARMTKPLEELSARLGELLAKLFGDRAPKLDLRDDDAMLRTMNAVAWADDFNSTVTRIRFALQILAWERLGGDLVILDRADVIVDPADRARLLRLLKGAGVPALVVFATREPAKAAGLLGAGLADRVYRVERGSVERLGEMQEAA